MSGCSSGPSAFSLRFSSTFIELYSLYYSSYRRFPRGVLNSRDRSITQYVVKLDVGDYPVNPEQVWNATADVFVFRNKVVDVGRSLKERGASCLRVGHKRRDI